MATSKQNWIYRYGLWLAIPLGMVLAWLLTPDESAFKQSATWQRLAEPGRLSAAHANLENNCAACHTSGIGTETSKCIVCHANNESLLQRQPTAFHGSISSCRECHIEHAGLDHGPTKMDHEALARIGLRQLDEDATDSENKALRSQLAFWLSANIESYSHISVLESTLDFIISIIL